MNLEKLIRPKIAYLPEGALEDRTTCTADNLTISVLITKNSFLRRAN